MSKNSKNQQAPVSTTAKTEAKPEVKVTEVKNPTAEELKAKAAQRLREANALRYGPTWEANDTLLSILAEGIRNAHNKMSAEKFRLLCEQAAKVQIFLGKGRKVRVEKVSLNRKGDEVVTTPKVALSWAKHDEDEKAAMMEAFSAGNVLKFSDPDTEESVELSM